MVTRKGKNKVKKKNIRAAKGKMTSSQAGRGRKISDRGIRLAVIGIGNVASALVQVLNTNAVNGIWHDRIGGYVKPDIKIVGAFDIDSRKVGLDLSAAIFSHPNVTPEFSKVPNLGTLVQPGLVGADVPKHLGQNILGTDKFLDLLKSSHANIVLNLIPSGMQDASYEYAEASLAAGCSFINATPATIATDPEIKRRFHSSGLVIAGDDLLSQFGGTAFHKGILEFMNRRGLVIEKSYQLDVGGGSETLNTITEAVKLNKRDIKTEAISEEIPYKFQTVAGTTDYVDYLGNNRTSYFWIQARTVFDASVKIDVYLRTNDGANAVNIILDVVRAVAQAQDRKEFGAEKEISDYGFKKLNRAVHLKDAQDEFLAHFG